MESTIFFRWIAFQFCIPKPFDAVFQLDKLKVAGVEKRPISCRTHDPELAVSNPAAVPKLTLPIRTKFLYDRDQRGTPLELAIADSLHYHNIPFGFNAHSGTKDPRREDYDIYTGQPAAKPFGK